MLHEAAWAASHYHVRVDSSFLTNRIGQLSLRWLCACPSNRGNFARTGYAGGSIV